MSIVKKTSYIVASLVGYLVAFNLVGVAACFFMDIWPSQGMSILVFHAVWFVLGVFLGMLHYQTAGDLCTPKSEERDWSDLDGSKATGALVIWVSATVLIALSCAFYMIWWRHDMAFDSFVPDNSALTITHFVAIIGAMCVARSALRSEKPSKATDSV